MKVKVISLPFIFQVLYVLCFTRPRYQVSVYRTIGPLVFTFMESFIFEQQVLQYLGLTFSVTLDLRAYCLGWNLEQLRIFLSLFLNSFMEFVFEHQVLFRVDIF